MTPPGAACQGPVRCRPQCGHGRPSRL